MQIFHASEGKVEDQHVVHLSNTGHTVDGMAAATIFNFSYVPEHSLIIVNLNLNIYYVQSQHYLFSSNPLIYHLTKLCNFILGHPALLSKKKLNQTAKSANILYIWRLPKFSRKLMFLLVTTA